MSASANGGLLRRRAMTTCLLLWGSAKHRKTEPKFQEKYLFISEVSWSRCVGRQRPLRARKREKSVVTIGDVMGTCWSVSAGDDAQEGSNGLSAGSGGSKKGAEVRGAQGTHGGAPTPNAGICDQRYKFGKELGTGAYSTVYLATDNEVRSSTRVLRPTARCPSQKETRIKQKNKRDRIQSRSCEEHHLPPLTQNSCLSMLPKCPQHPGAAPVAIKKIKKSALQPHDHQALRMEVSWSLFGLLCLGREN